MRARHNPFIPAQRESRRRDNIFALYPRTVIVDGEPVRSCLIFAVQADGKRIRTVEGLADGEKLHPMQQAFMDHHGLQCGFCTPGFLMLAVGVLEREPDISDDDLLDVLSSNLCRCTGYQNIIKAVRAAAKEMRK